LCLCKSIFDHPKLKFIQPASDFLTVACYERNGSTTQEEPQRLLNLLIINIQHTGDTMAERIRILQ
jgi:hypothetical protein